MVQKLAAFDALQPHTDFIGRHIGPAEPEKKAMLTALGFDSMEAFIKKVVPAAILSDKALELGEPVQVTACRQTFPGQSQETWLVDTEVAGGTRGFVLRVNPPGGGIVPIPLRREWEVYSRLAGSPVPVGQPHRPQHRPVAAQADQQV